MTSGLRKVLILGGLINVLIARLVGLAVIGLITPGLPLIGIRHRLSQGQCPDCSS